MSKLLEILLKNGWVIKWQFNGKAFTVTKGDGNYSSTVTISKYKKKYEIDGFEGSRNLIKTFKKEAQTYKEVLDFIGISV